MTNATRRIARNDSLLNTGLTSAADRKRFEKQEELHNKRSAQKEAQRAALGNLTRRGELISEWIAEERSALDSISNLMLTTDIEAAARQYPVLKTINVDNDSLMKAQLIARLMHIDWLKKLEKKVKSTLREERVEKTETVS